jgi:hypothetical protein
MANIDWEQAGQAAINGIARIQRNEESTKDRLAREIGEKIAKDRNADVTSATLQFRTSEAKLAGITESLEIVRDYCLRGKPTTE